MRDTATAQKGGSQTAMGPTDGLETAEATFECTECGTELPARRGECIVCGTWWTPMDCMPGQMRQITAPAEGKG